MPSGTVRLVSSLSFFWPLLILCTAAAATGIASVAVISRRNRRTLQALRLRNRAIESSVNAVMIAGPGGRIEDVNPAFTRITGHPAEETAGSDISLLFDDETDSTDAAHIRSAIADWREGHATLRCRRRDGSHFWGDLHVAPVSDAAGRATHFVAVLNDVTEVRDYQQQLERQTNFDLLTELPNRNLLRDRLQQALALAQRHKHIVAVALLNLDNFSFVNDSLGHDGGDEVLKLVAQRIRSCVRTTDTVARLAGDEFVLLLSGIANEENIPRVLQRIVDAISTRPQVTDTLQKVLSTVSRPIMLRDRELDITCSIGVSLYPHDGQESEALLKNAEAAMRRAKEMGRNNFQFYTAELNRRLGDRLALQTLLRRALERNEFLLHYQPKVDLRRGRVSGAEALLRWNSPDRGMVPPIEFIATLEDSGLIVEVGRWIIEQAVAQHARWREHDANAPRIAVNISQIQLVQKNFVTMMREIVERYGRGSCGLDIEITESLIMKDVEQNVAKLRALKELGIGIAIDDFGTGYSSFSHLATLPIDALKIDRSFVVTMAGNSDHHAIVSGIVSLAHLLKHKVVAEGVDSAEQVALLREMSCDEIQGFVFSRPLPAAEFDAWRKGFTLGKAGPDAAGF